MGALLQLPQTARRTQRKDALRSTQRKAIINKRDVPRATAPYTFKAAIHDQVGTLDFDAVEAEVVQAAKSLVSENPDVGAILLECTDLPPYAAAIQEAIGLSVYDVSTLMNYGVVAAVRSRFTD